LKVLLRNFQLSDDVSFRFSNKGWSEWPLTADKFAGWINALDPKHEVLNLFMDYSTFGERQWADTGIFDFMRALPAIVLKKTKYRFLTPSELAKKLQPVSAVHVPYAMSWADTERDLTAWLGNALQEDAFSSLYSIEQKVRFTSDTELLRDWNYLQTSDHFYYMSTKWFSDGETQKLFNPYPSPYEAYINYMNVLSDFMIRIDKASPQPDATITLAEKPPVALAKQKTTKKTAAKPENKTAAKPKKKTTGKKTVPLIAKKGEKTKNKK